MYNYRIYNDCQEYIQDLWDSIGILIQFVNIFNLYAGLPILSVNILSTCLFSFNI